MTERLTTALQIVRLLADRPDPLQPMTVGTLAQLVRTSTSSASRICAELEGHGLIARAEGYGAYRIGARAVALSGSAAVAHSRAVDFALTLAYQTTSETVALVAAAPGGAIVLAVVQSAWTLHVATAVNELLTEPDSAARTALRTVPGGSAPLVVSSAAGVTTEIATPILGSGGDVLAAVVVRYPSARSEQVTPVARRAVVIARKHLESSARAGLPPAGEAAPRCGAGTDSAIGAAATLLDALAGSGPHPIAELAKTCGMRSDRVRRLLRICLDAGIVAHNTEQDTARLHWGIHGWHRAIVDGILRGPAQQLVTAAALAAGATTYLTVRRGMRSSTVTEAIVDGALNMGSWLGRPAQLIGSDGGPVLVMHLADTQIREVFPARITMTARGTPRDLEAFLLEVQRARTDDVLVLENFGEDGLTSVAAPVRNAGGAVAAAACMVGPGQDVAARMSTIKHLVCKLAADVSLLLRDPSARPMRE